MALYAIGDLHLSIGTDKPMDVFGGKWEGYIDKLRTGFSELKPEDTCVICGDISWAMGLNESRKDFQFIESLPGTKIVLKGNHDFWWSTASKMTKFFEREGIGSIRILHTTAVFTVIRRYAEPEAGFLRKKRAAILIKKS
jgi:predicted phosphohydrolase